MKVQPIILSIALLSSLAHAEVYKWKDSSGVHFTDNPLSVPEKYREKVYEQARSEMQSRSPQVIPQVNHQVITHVPQRPPVVIPQINHPAPYQVNIERQKRAQEELQERRAKADEQSRKSIQAFTSTLLKYGLFCVIGGSLLKVVKNNKRGSRSLKKLSRSWSGEIFDASLSDTQSHLKLVAQQPTNEHEVVACADDYHLPPFSVPASPIISTWDDPVLSIIEWRRFETVCVEFFKMKGYRAEETRVGADGGVDIHLYIEDLYTPVAVVQCKAWNTYRVGVKPIRELFGVMAGDQIEEGFFVTSGEFTQEALEFAQGKKLHFMTGERLLAEIKKLSIDQQEKLLKVALDGDYSTPTCPQCDVKMTIRKGKSGRNAGEKFWGCVNYPRCRQTFKYKDIDIV